MLEEKIKSHIERIARFNTGAPLRPNEIARLRVYARQLLTSLGEE